MSDAIPHHAHTTANHLARARHEYALALHRMRLEAANPHLADTGTQPLATAVARVATRLDILRAAERAWEREHD